MSEIAIIVALDNQFGFAKKGKIPWYYPEDFKHFRNLTLNNICVMGKNTYLDINERLGDKQPNVLPNRFNVVISSTLTLQDVSNAMVYNSFEKAQIELYGDIRSIFLIGGQQIFEDGLRIADTLYITHIQKDYKCDQFFDMDYVQNNFEIEEVIFGNTPELLFIKYTRNK